MKIRRIILYMLYYSGITNVMYKIGTKSTMILVYHRVLNLDSNFEFDPRLVSASINNFKKQMGYLSKKYNVISLEQFVDYHKRKNLPKNSVVITLDDGYRDNYLYAYPILKEYGLPATIFLATEAIEKNKLFWWDRLAYLINKTKVDNLKVKGIGNYSLKNKRLTALKKIQFDLKQISEAKKSFLINKLSGTLNVRPKFRNIYLGWDEIKKMSPNKISFGAHTASHPILTNIPIEEAKKEILKSKEVIEKNLNSKVNLFSYPNGEDSDFNVKIKNMLKQIGFECAVSSIPGRNTPSSDLFALKRVFVRYDEDMLLFRNKLIGIDVIFGKVYHALKKIRKKVRMSLC